MISGQFDAIIPMLCVDLAGLVVLLAESFRGKGEKMPIGGLAIIGLVGAGAASILLWDRNAESFGVVTADNFALFVNLVLVAVGILTVMFSSQTVERDRLPAGEYYAIMLFAIVGMMLMAQATDLLVIFLALETMSIAVYVLTGIRRDQQQSTEAAFKYFLLGAFASSFFLYGIAFLYGVTGTTNIERIVDGDRRAVDERQPDDPARHRPADRRLRVQDRGGAVPHVVARRLRRRARRWSPASCPPASRPRRSPRSCACSSTALDPMIADWAPVLWVDRRRDDDRRHGGRRGADQPQAHAGVFEHRARRLPAGGPGRRQRRRQGRDPVLPGRLRADQPRRLRRDRAARHARARQRRPARLRRPVALAPGAWRR